MDIRYVDLHVHSTFSDGRYTPEELVGMAARAELTALALADHDSVDGIERALAAAQTTAVEIIPAVELSSQWGDITDLHLLGYGFDYRDDRLTSELQQFQDFRAERNVRIIDKVNDKLRQEGRLAIDAAKVRALAGGTIGRPHIAMELCRAGYVDNSEEAFDRYLVPCNVPKLYFPADKAIELIHTCSGLAVLAHPPYITRDHGRLEKLVEELVAMGLDGIEVYNNGAGLEETDWLMRLARRHDLIITGGSDFHGDPGSIVEIGRGLRGMRVPYECVEQIKSALHVRRRCTDGL